MGITVKFSVKFTERAKVVPQFRKKIYKEYTSTSHLESLVFFSQLSQQELSAEKLKEMNVFGLLGMK